MERLIPKSIRMMGQYKKKKVLNDFCARQPPHGHKMMVSKGHGSWTVTLVRMASLAPSGRRSNAGLVTPFGSDDCFGQSWYQPCLTNCSHLFKAVW